MGQRDNEIRSLKSSEKSGTKLVSFSLDARQLDVGVEGRVQVRQRLRVAALPQTRHHGLLGQHGLLGFAAGVLDGSELDELVHRFELTQGVHLG